MTHTEGMNMNSAFPAINIIFIIILMAFDLTSYAMVLALGNIMLVVCKILEVLQQQIKKDT